MSSSPECFDLPESVRYDLTSFDKFDLTEDQIGQSYDSLLDQNMKLERDNHEYNKLVSQLQLQLNQYESKFQSQQQSINALQQQLSVQQAAFDTKFTEFLVCANEYDHKKTQELVSMKKERLCLNKQYDNLLCEYNKLQRQYMMKQSVNNEYKIYKTWKWYNIYEWIINMINDERLNKYRDILLRSLRDQDINGCTLPSLNDDDLYYLGIKDQRDRDLLSKYILRLIGAEVSSDMLLYPSSATDRSVSLNSLSSSSTICTEHTHKLLNPQQLKQVRIRQQNIVYVVGLPVSLCNAKLLKSEKWFGKFGAISRICFNTSPKCVKANSIPTFVTFTNEIDAEDAIQKMNLFCLSDGTRLKTNYGRTKYCPSFCQGIQCLNSKCKFLHQFAKYDDIITEQEINDFNAIRAGPPSRGRHFNHK